MAGSLSSSCLAGLAVWVVPPPASGAVRRQVLAVREGARGALVRIDGVGDVGAAHELTGRWLMAEEASLPALPIDLEDEIGFEVRDVRHGRLGVVVDVIVTGANDVLVVEEGAYGQVLLPVIDEVVLEVDEEAHVVTVSVLPGLIEGID